VKFERPFEPAARDAVLREVVGSQCKIAADVGLLGYCRQRQQRVQANEF
jgi:hypothetical protein